MQTETANFEIISLNPNINYEESDYESDDSEDEEMKQQQVVIQEEEDSIQSISNDSCDVQQIAKRRKLNLEEYKIKRANQPAPPIDMTSRANVLELCECPASLPRLPLIDFNLPSDPRSIKTIINQISMKKQQQLEEQFETENKEDSTITEEKQIVVAATAAAVSAPATLHPDYEEIILVSIQCNTDISIPPNEDVEHQPNSSATKFLTNIVNNIEDDKAKTLLADTSTNTLFSSINAVLQEKSKSNNGSSTDKSLQTISNESVDEHHGEDKVIMHLRKDRIRPHRSTRSLQTDVSPLFPPLILSPALIFNRIKNIKSYRRHSSRSRSRSRSRSISPESDYYGQNSNYHNMFNARFNHTSTYSSSMNSSEMESYSSDSDSSAYSSARSSDQGSLKRFDTYKGYRTHKYRNDNNGFYREERKIIYVGEILEKTTKDELRRKFLKYGTIKKISIHKKDDGSLRYGFVTFAESSAAYEVLDKFRDDPTISNFDLRFGGRRKFCKQGYADLDNERDNDTNNNNNNNNKASSKTEELSFEDLLNMTKKKLCSKK